jgi:hypothetical protein
MYQRSTAVTFRIHTTCLMAGPLSSRLRESVMISSSVRSAVGLKGISVETRRRYSLGRNWLFGMWYGTLTPPGAAGSCKLLPVVWIGARGVLCAAGACVRGVCVCGARTRRTKSRERSVDKCSSGMGWERRGEGRGGGDLYEGIIPRPNRVSRRALCPT